MATGSAQYEHVQSRDNSRMHNGNNYNYTANNTNFFHVPKKPPNDAVHLDLIRACAERARTPRLHYLLSQGANVDHKDEMKCTPLHHAVDSGSMETISAIVQAGADVNAVTERYGTPLCLAAIRRDLAAVEFLIDHNASVNKYCNELGSAAHAACAGGDLAVIRALHAAGADWATSKDICVIALSYLSWLFRNGGSLLEHVHHKPSYSRCQAQSPGAVAVRFRHSEAVDFCLGLAKGLDVHEPWKTTSHFRVVYNFETGSIISSPLGTKLSLLSLAMSTLDVRTAELLLDHGVRDNLLDPVGRGALAQALDATRLPTTNIDDLDSCVKLLVRHGVDINGLRSPGSWIADVAESFVETWNRDYISGNLLLFPMVYVPIVYVPEAQSEVTTALMYTIRRKSYFKSLSHCVDVLCKNGARVDVRDKDGRSALSVARECLEGEQRILVEKILLSHSDVQPVE